MKKHLYAVLCIAGIVMVLLSAGVGTLVSVSISPASSYTATFTGDTVARTWTVTVTTDSPDSTDTDEDASQALTVHATDTVTIDGTPRDLSGTYIIEPTSGFITHHSEHAGLTYFFPRPSEESSYWVEDPIVGHASIMDYLDPATVDGIKAYTYGSTDPRYREITVAARTGIILDWEEDVDGHRIRWDDTTRADALHRAHALDKTLWWQRIGTGLLRFVGAILIVLSGGLWLRAIT